MLGPVLSFPPFRLDVGDERLWKDGTELKLAVVHGLRNARVVAEQVRAGTCPYDLIEVMACPGGCIGGA